MSTHRLQVLIPNSLDAQLRKAAHRSRVSRGEWVRRALERVLAEERSAADPLATLAALDAPTGDIEEMLKEIDTGRG